MRVTASKLRKVDFEYNFSTKSGRQKVFSQVSFQRQHCLRCQESVAAFKEHNMRRYFFFHQAR